MRAGLNRVGWKLHGFTADSTARNFISGWRKRAQSFARPICSQTVMKEIAEQAKQWVQKPAEGLTQQLNVGFSDLLRFIPTIYLFL